MIKTKPKFLAILGYPLGHSLSPRMQQAALSYRGLPWFYIPLEVRPSRLAQAVHGLRALENFAGANVTIPHKAAIIPFLDLLSVEAQATGAVNTIVVAKGGWKGYNTDIQGFLEPLKRRGFFLTGKRAVVLGAGGAARAVLYALGREGAEAITVLCRQPSRAQKMVASLKAYLNKTAVAIYTFDHPRASTDIADAHLLVNATPLGINPHETPPVSPRSITRRTLVYDLIYNPPLTPLLKMARGKGARILNGQGMLVAQGAKAFELWTKQPAPKKLMEETLNKALKAKRK